MIPVQIREIEGPFVVICCVLNSSFIYYLSDSSLLIHPAGRSTVTNTSGLPAFFSPVLSKLPVLW